ncbi:hypothetical protein PDQ72_30930 [Bacillus cereus]|uniref:Uncharacterized protein n=1 Tax=Bacillus thuringiensis TaxID=1428 RepID=A0A9X6KBT4_BACTU|nr:hypothetical protein [Bacillus thuringiensis]MDA2616032.1 hypothetical protein [Bacillus cereus]MEB8975211.1 hypothetical protein [Bacillus cereus]MRC62955.1 hypothetical protein [Bacillus thuringiensis]OTZ94843.1 hypothetical protein BK774_29430 [Bacillus thuringiensis]
MKKSWLIFGVVIVIGLIFFKAMTLQILGFLVLLVVITLGLYFGFQVVVGFILFAVAAIGIILVILIIVYGIATWL